MNESESLDPDRPLSTQIVEAIADSEGVAPSAVTPSLYHAVEPDALDRLFEAGAGSGGGPVHTIEFRYCGYDVRVADGAVAVTAAEPSTPETPPAS